MCQVDVRNNTARFFYLVWKMDLKKEARQDLLHAGFRQVDIMRTLKVSKTMVFNAKK